MVLNLTGQGSDCVLLSLSLCLDILNAYDPAFCYQKGHHTFFPAGLCSSFPGPNPPKKSRVILTFQLDMLSVNFNRGAGTLGYRAWSETTRFGNFSNIFFSAGTADTWLSNRSLPKPLFFLWNPTRTLLGFVSNALPLDARKPGCRSY